MPETTHDQRTPREVLDTLLRGLTGPHTGSSWEALPDLYADDAVVEHPFGTATPSRWEGREQVRRHFADGGRHPLEFEVHNLAVHETTDPEVIIAEFDYHERITTGGHRFTVGNILVIRVRDGLIVSSRDYHDHATIGTALAHA